MNRRTFLRGMGALAATTALTPSAIPRYASGFGGKTVAEMAALQIEANRRMAAMLEELLNPIVERLTGLDVPGAFKVMLRDDGPDIEPISLRDVYLQPEADDIGARGYYGRGIPEMLGAIPGEIPCSTS